MSLIRKPAVRTTEEAKRQALSRTRLRLLSIPFLSQNRSKVLAFLYSFESFKKKDVVKITMAMPINREAEDPLDSSLGIVTPPLVPLPRLHTYHLIFLS